MFFQRSRARGLTLVVALLLPIARPTVAQDAPATGASEPESTGNSRLHGKVRGPEGKTPATGVIIHAYHLESGKLYSSQPTGQGGSYEIDGLPFGYFDVAVETDEGLFVAMTVVEVLPSGKTFALLLLKRYEDQPESWWASHDRRELPGSDQTSTGIAEVLRKRRGGEFLKSKKGVIILAGSGAVILFAIAASDETTEVTASPSMP